MKILTFILAAAMAANGVFMFIDPPAWYAAPAFYFSNPASIHGPGLSPRSMARLIPNSP